MSMPIITPPPAQPAAPATGADPAAPEGDENPTPPPAAEAPKPTETVDYWKQRSRENEARAKANAEAASRLQELEDAQKSEAQRLADATARAQREAEEAKADALRYRVAAAHQVGEDYFDLLGSGDEETLNGRGERLSDLIAAKNENEQLKTQIAELQAQIADGRAPMPLSRPVASLRPGATPTAQESSADADYYALFPDERPR